MSPADLLPVPLATDAVLTVLFEGSLLLGATWVAVALLRRHSPALRHTVWTSGFVLALLVPLAGMLLPVRSLGLVPYPLARTPTPALAGGAGAGLPAAAPFPGLPDPGRTMRLVEGMTVLDPAPASAPEGSRIGPALATGFLVLWGAGAAALLFRLVGHRVRVGRITRRGTRAPSGDVPSRLVRREIARMGIRRPVRVIYSSDLPVPVTWGVLRPVLLLPPDAGSWRETRLRAVVVHELAHVRRWDALSQQLAELARALYWANPLVWVGRRLAARERESACDDEVLRRGMASSEYAAVLVEMARRGARAPRHFRPEVEGGLALAGPSRLEARVAAVLEGRAEHRASGAAPAVAAVLALTLVAAPLAGTSLMADAPEPPDDDSSLPTRLRIVRALGMECDEVSLWTLARTLQEDPASPVRKAAARALGSHDDPRTVAILAHTAGDGLQDPGVRRVAIHALARRGSRGAADALLARLRDGDPAVRRDAVHALGHMHRQSERIRGTVAGVLLRDTDPTVRAAAAEALGGVGCEASVRWLRRALRDSSGEVVREAKRALERIRGS